jgi:Fe-S oxidoreductase
LHHSELLNELIQQGRLPRLDSSQENNGLTTYHDPCYLARAAGVTEAPRNVLAVSVNGSPTPNLVELPRNRRATSCCGAGGGRMWFDDAVDGRVGQDRVQEIVELGAANVAVSCPFCLIMLNDGLAAKKPEVRVRDIAEMLADAVFGPEESMGGTP